MLLELRVVLDSELARLGILGATLPVLFWCIAIAASAPAQASGARWSGDSRRTKRLLPLLI